MPEYLKSTFNEIRRKIVKFSDINTKTIIVNGIELGVFKGFASTYNNIDRGGDVIRPGAFTESLKRHQETDRQIRMFFQHNQMFPIGGFPIAEIEDNEKGLLVTGHINLQVEKGIETFALIKQGVISDLSIGFSIEKSFHDEDDVFNLTQLELWEISPVTEPMNPEANIIEVKGATTFKDLPLAPRTRPWSSREAIARVREFTNSQDKPSRTYRNAFFWFDNAEADNFGGYKLPFADVINGKLVAVPRGVFAAAGVMNGARGGVDLPSADRPKVERHINKYYDKMGLDSPLKSVELAEHYKVIFGSSDEDFYQIENDERITKKDIEEIKTIRDIENYLKTNFSFQSKESKILISKIKSLSRDVNNDSGSTRDAETLEEDKATADSIVQKIAVCDLSIKLGKINSLLNSKGKQNVQS